jgi:hypothetical protein
MKTYSILFLICVSAFSFAKSPRTLYLNDTKMGTIYVSPNRTAILSFPTKPSKIILGQKSLFAVEYVEQDLAISPLKVPASSNLFVYLEGRRFGFNLVSGSGGDDIVVIKDAEEKPKKRTK